MSTSTRSPRRVSRNSWTTKVPKLFLSLLSGPTSTPGASAAPPRVDDAPPYSPSRPQPLPFTLVTRSKPSKRARQRAAKAAGAPKPASPNAPTPAPTAPTSSTAATPAPAPAPPPPAPATKDPVRPPLPLLQDADSVARRDQWAALEDPLPLYTIVAGDDLPPPEKVHNSYRVLLASQGIPPGSPDYTAALDAIEVGWGGLPGNFDACIGYRARYAFSAGYPIAPSLVVNLFAGSSSGAQRTRVLRDADIHLGGPGDGLSLTPLAFFCKNAPWNLLFVED